MILRDFFTEAPYAAALCSDLLLTRCSSCFDAGKADWTCGTCGQVVYCSEQCSQADRRWHEYECVGLRSNRRPKRAATDVDIRLLGRLIVRYRFDNGVAVLSSSDFPSSVVKDRRLDDLLSHERDFAKMSWYENRSAKFCNWFMIFFQSTPMASLKPEALKRWHCIASINGFSVTALTTKGVPSSIAYLGEALYLNASRFDHSCRPSLLFGFIGSRLVAKFVEDCEDSKGNGETSKTSKTITKKQLNKLTFNYGFGTSWNYTTSFSMTAQRIESLRARYFFRCRCSLCQDKKTDLLQSHSAQIECSRCCVPYLWRVKRRSNKAKLTRACRCPWNKEVADKSHWCHELDVRQCAKKLNDDWECIMDRACKADSANEVLEMCEPFRNLAAQYWSKTYNVRLAQLCEKVFEAYWKKLFAMKLEKSHDSSKSQAMGSQFRTSSPNPVTMALFHEGLRDTLEIGEIMISTYMRYAQPYDMTVAVFSHRMAALYCLSFDEEGPMRASQFYLKAGEMWKLHGYTGCHEYYEQLSAWVLSRGKLRSQEATEPTTTATNVMIQ